FAKNKYVTFTSEELDAIEAQSTQTIEITEFLPLEEIDTIYYDKSYYLGPDKGGDRAYRLLSAALRKTKRIAIAKYAARGKMYLVAVLPKDDGLLLQQLHFADEVKDFADIPRQTGNVDDTEMTLAQKLIEQSTYEEFHPESYHDEVRERLQSLVEKKVQGEDITVQEEEAPRAKVVDLMAALRASLDKKGASVPAAEDRKPAKKAAKKAPAAKKKAKG
ncbi:MAG: Ku protein, partial [Myxococcota bacterium]